MDFELCMDLRFFHPTLLGVNICRFSRIFHYGKLSDLIIEFQLATNPAELFPGWKLESQEEEMIDYAFKMRGFSLRIFSRPLCSSSTDVALWFMEFRRRQTRGHFASVSLFFCYTTFLAKNLSFGNFLCSRNVRKTSYKWYKMSQKSHSKLFIKNVSLKKYHLKRLILNVSLKKFH